MFRFLDHQVFNHENFSRRFAALTQETLFCLRISCPYVFLKRVERCRDFFGAAIQREVCIADIQKANAILIAHYQRMYAGMKEVMSSVRTSRIMRISKNSAEMPPLNFQPQTHYTQNTSSLSNL